MESAKAIWRIFLLTVSAYMHVYIISYRTVFFFFFSNGICHLYHLWGGMCESCCVLWHNRWWQTTCFSCFKTDFFMNSAPSFSVPLFLDWRLLEWNPFTSPSKEHHIFGSSGGIWRIFLSYRTLRFNVLSVVQFSGYSDISDTLS